MNKPSTKKMLTVLITLAMVFSALAVLSIAAQPAYAASGTFTVNPTTYTVGTTSGTSTVAFVSGGTFGSGSTVFFFLSTTTSSSGIVSGSGTSVTVSGVLVSNAIGGISLAAGTTSLSNAVTFTMYSGAGAGTYYILAEDYLNGVPSGTYALGPQVTLVSPIPTLTIINLATLEPATATYKSALTVGSTGLAVGSGFDAGASINVYLNYPGSSVVLTTATVNSAGSFKATFTVPALSGTVGSGDASLGISPYTVAAEEMNTLSVSFPEGGITADSALDVAPSITVSPMSTPGTTGSTFTITGAGFVAGQTIAANSITIDSVTTSHSSVTVSTSGAFTVTVTLTSAISSSGGQTVSITASGPSASDTFPDAVYKSVPTLSALGFSFTDVSPTALSTASGYPGDSVQAAVWNFPASATVTVTLGPYTVGTITTDSNGFGQLPSTAVIPEMPYGSYIPTASVASQGVYATLSAFTVNSQYFAMDPVGNVFGTTTTYYSSTEYIPYNANVTVFAYGLDPLTSYVFEDSGSASIGLDGNVLALGLVVSISVGTPNAVGTAIYPAANGTIIFTYQPFYAFSYSTSVTTGTPATVTILGNSYYSGTVTTTNTLAKYFEIGAPTISSPTQGASLVPGTTESVTLANLVPFGATVYPTASDIYSLYLGPDLLKVTLSGVTGTTFEVAPSATTVFSVSASGITFTVPSGINGLQSLAVVFAGAPASSALVSEYVVVTTPASTSSAVGAIGALYNSTLQTLYVWGYNFPNSLSTITVDYMMYSSGAASVSPPVSSGGFFDSVVDLSEPAGTYAVFLPSYPTLAPVTYTVSPYFVSQSGGMVPVGTPITVTAYGLQPDQNYLLYLGPVFVDEEITTSAGIFSESETVPLIAAGTYNLTLSPASSPSTVVLSQPFTVVPNSAISLSTMSQYAFPGQLVQFTADVGTFTGIPTGATVTYSAEISLNGTLLEDVPAAYSSGYISGSFKMPNNLVGSYYEIGITGLASYTYTEPITTAESLPLTASAYTTTSSSGAVTLTVTFTDPDYGTLTTAAITAAGSYDLETSSAGSTPYYAAVSSFTAPTSSAAGSITFSIDTILPLTTTYADTITSSPTAITIPTTATATSSIETVSGTYVTYVKQAVQFSGVSSTSRVSDFFGLVQGNGALLTGISSSEIATITADVTSAVTTSMQVPLQELNASVVAINGVVAKIDTAFGNMTATLSAINATVASISSGQALVVTDLGTIETSLSSLNASLVSVSGNVATLSTTLGTVQASLSSINATVTSSASSISGLVGSVATIQTSLGTISGTITSISNGMATIQTDVGTINASASQIATSVGQVKTDTSAIPTLEIFLIVTIVLVLITLVVAFLAVNSSNKLAKKLEEQKKQ